MCINCLFEALEERQKTLLPPVGSGVQTTKATESTTNAAPAKKTIGGPINASPWGITEAPTTSPFPPSAALWGVAAPAPAQDKSKADNSLPLPAPATPWQPVPKRKPVEMASKVHTTEKPKPTVFVRNLGNGQGIRLKSGNVIVKLGPDVYLHQGLYSKSILYFNLDDIGHMEGTLLPIGTEITIKL